jgi:MFS-type transporter involved in bile tolerance (Atg22 family)
VGPLLAGPLLATIGVQGAYAVSFLFAGLAFTSIRRVETSSRGGVVTMREVAANLGEGLSYVRRTGPVLAIFVLVTAHCALTMSFDAMLPGFAESHLHSPAAGFTLMTLGVGTGALVGTFVLAILRDSQRGTLLLATAIASGLSPVLMSVSMQIPMATFSAILMGSSQAMFMAVTAVLLQQVVPDEVRGRVMSLYLMSAGGIMAFANLGLGSLADATGVPVLFLVPAVIFLIIVAFSATLTGHLKTIYRTGFPAPAPSPVTAAAGD